MGTCRANTFPMRKCFSNLHFKIHRPLTFSILVFSMFSSNKHWWQLHAFSFLGRRTIESRVAPPSEGKLWHMVSLIASCISSWRHNGHIILAFIIYHIHALHLRKSLNCHTYLFSMLFFLANCIHYVIIVCMLCIILPYSCSCLMFPSLSPKVTMKCESLHHIFSFMCWVP